MSRAPLSSSQFSLKGLLLVVTFIGLMIGGCKLISTSVNAQGLSATAASGKLGSILSPIVIPAEATNCSVKGSFRGTSIATFEIDEKSFLEQIAKRYSQLKGYDPLPYSQTQDINYAFRLLHPAGIDDNSRGYAWDGLNERGGWLIAYDATKQRAYMLYSYR